MLTAPGIFISHRSEDQAVADALKRGLERLASSAVEVHLAAHMRGSSNWREWIEAKVATSSALLFLYTDKHADWDWCIYEIGLFRGKKGTGNGRRGPRNDLTGIACIKDVDIKTDELPPQMRDLQVYEANESGLLKLFGELVFDGVYTNRVPLKVRPKVGDREGARELEEDLKRIVDETVQSFRHRTTFFRYRLGLSLCRPGERGVVPLPSEEWTVTGTKEAMSILGASGETESWPRLRQRLSSQAKGDVEWLDDLQREIAEIAVRRDDTIDDPVLRPFRSASGRTYIPVVSRTETFRLPERGGTWSSSGAESPNVIPSKVFVILVPALSRVVGFRNLADFFESDACTVYPPTSVVRVRWKRKSSGDKYSKDDLDGAPVICGANAKFKQLFDHTGAVPHPDARNAWTLDELLKRISDYVDDEVMQRLRDDQAKLQTHILFDGGDDFATEKLAILATAKEGKVRTHRYFVGKTFLPYLVAKQTVGDTSGPHEQFVLVSFVEF